MAVRYNRLKQMKSARVGTMMAWVGDGFDGNTVSSLPKGWILCDGKTYQASRYPLLASILGDTYGGSNFAGSFPNYTGTFIVPNLSSRMPIDLESSMLDESTYQYGQSDAKTVLGTRVSGFGDTTPISTLLSANADIVFTLSNTTRLVGKMTKMSITPPDFGATVYTIPRKLSLGHLPSHSHPGLYTRATAELTGPMIFESAKINLIGQEQSGCSCPQNSGNEANNIECQVADADTLPSWRGGRQRITYFGEVSNENTLVSTDKFYDFVQGTSVDPGTSNKTVTGSSKDNDWQHVPPYTWKSTLKNVFDGSSYSSTFLEEPAITHSQDAWSGYFPKPGLYFNKNNFFGLTDPLVTGSTGVVNDPEAVPMVEYTVSFALNSNKFQLPAGSDIGTYFDKIKPFMLVKASVVPAGTSIQKINRISGTSTSNYVYEIEMTENATAAATSVTVKIGHGTYPTTMNTTSAGQDPSKTTFAGHSHSTFDFFQSIGSLIMPSTHPVEGETTGVSIGNVNPEKIDDALNIIADTQMPSVNCTFMIKAY